MTFARIFPSLTAMESELRLLFDVEFYTRQLDTPAPASGDMLVHYLEHGWTEGLDPHPLFSTNFYLEKNPDAERAGIAPLVHYLNADVWTIPSFHPLFDVRFYLSQLPNWNVPERNLLVHYLREGDANGFSPHPLFDRAYYRRHLNRDAHHHVGLLHYLTWGYREGRNPHPLFNIDYYYSQSPQLREAGREPLGHYLTSGWRSELDPHPLFSTGYYLLSNRDVAESGTCPLLHFVTRGYLDRRPFHPLFSSEYYLDQARTRETEPSWKQNLLIDYVERGWKAQLSPTPLFDPDFYAAASELEEFGAEGPLVHFLTEGFRKGLDPHPAFDTQHYIRHTDSIRPGSDNALLHFLRHNGDQSPFPLFDPEWYARVNADLARNGIPAGKHYLEHGFREDRGPNALRSQQYLYNLCPDVSFATDHYLTTYRLRRINKRRRLLFIGHEATRTGAPLILLNIVRHFSAHSNVECITLLDRGGPLVDEFAKVSHVYQIENPERAFLDGGPYSKELTSEIRRVLALFADNPPAAIVANSAEVTHLAGRVAEPGTPLIFLVHESGQFYSPSQIQKILDCSDTVVFPSRATSASHIAQCPAAEEKSVVIPQGLLDECFGARCVARGKEQLLRDLGVEEDAFIVLGCGTVDLRKGADLFVNVAAAVLRQAPPTAPIHFMWVGKGSEKFGSYLYWLKLQLKNIGFEHQVHFIPEQQDVEPFFNAADVFLLTSRVDPFPCVVHEAMACGVPVIAFKEGGGAPEAIAETGFAVPGFDTAQMAEHVLELFSRHDLREELAQRARHRVATVFRFRDYASRLRQLIARQLDVTETSFGDADAGRTRRKIVFTTPDWSISGVNTFSVHLIKKLIAKGYDAELLFTRGRFTHRASTEQNIPDVPFRFLQPKDARPESVWLSVQEYLEANRPCIFVPNYDYVASTIGANLPSDIGIIGILHSDDVEHYEHMRRLGLFWNRIVTVSQRIHAQALLVNRSYESKISTIHYGIPTDSRAPRRFSQSSQSQGEVRPLTILYAGRLVQKQKRILDFVKLVDQLESRAFPYELILVGDGESRTVLESQLAEPIACGKVVMPGRVPHNDMKQYYERADVFTLLSDFEGLPLAMLEAMERGCIPVVSEMESGISEVIRNEENGFVFPRNDWVKCAAILQALHGDAEGRLRIAAEARCTILNEFSDTQMAERYAEVADRVFEEIRSGVYVRPPAAQHLDATGGAVWPSESLNGASANGDPPPDNRHSTNGSEQSSYRGLVQRIRQTADHVLPAHGTVVVVSKGDGELLKLGGRTAWHFPQNEDGVYAGYYPADSTEAIQHLEALRERGARFLLFPSTAFWWLESYRAFTQHLESRYRVLAREEGTCLIYGLGSDSEIRI